MTSESSNPPSAPRGLRSVTSADATNPSSLRHLREILLDVYNSKTTITWKQLASRMTQQTEQDWSSHVGYLIRPIKQLNELFKGHLFFACVVGEDQMPKSGFFKAAIERGLFSKDANAETRFDVWKAQRRWFENLVERMADDPELSKRIQDRLEHMLEELGRCTDGPITAGKRL